MTLKLGTQHRVLKYYQVCSNDDPGLTLPLQDQIWSLMLLTGHGSSMGSEFAWHASGPEFNPHVRHILPWRLGHENISTAILPLPLIQKEQLSVSGERMCTKNW